MFKALKKYKYDILICSLIVFISIIEGIHAYYDAYLGGLRNSPSFTILLIFSYESLKIVIVLFAIVRIFSGINNIQKLKRYIITAILTILIFIGVWVVSFKIDMPNVYPFLNGYEKWVQKNVEIDKIQEWLASGEADKYIPSYYLDNFPKDLPDFMENFERQHILFNDKETERGKSIEFMWGSALGHWGIVIGMPTINNIQENKVTIHSAEKECRLQIQPGVFIFDRSG
jgi:hypothetical protein